MFIGITRVHFDFLDTGMIMGASASSVWYNLRVPHPTKQVPIIDYDLALLFQPMLMLGITIGVALSVVFPYWLITVLIIILFLSMYNDEKFIFSPTLFFVLLKFLLFGFGQFLLTFLNPLVFADYDCIRHFVKVCLQRGFDVEGRDYLEG